MTSWSRLKEVYERWPTLILAGLVFGFLLSIEQLFPTAPAPLLAVLIGTAAVAIFDLQDHGVAVVGEIGAGLPQFVMWI